MSQTVFGTQTEVSQGTLGSDLGTVSEMLGPRWYGILLSQDHQKKVGCAVLTIPIPPSASVPTKVPSAVPLWVQVTAAGSVLTHDVKHV